MGRRNWGHETGYLEYDGEYEFEYEQYFEIALTADNDMHTVTKGKDGQKVSEFFVVDDIEYTLDFEGEWQAVTVGDWWNDSDDENTGPGEDAEGTVGPVGQVDDSHESSGKICGLPVSMFTGATDYGMEELGGISVRHVALLAGPSSYEYWVNAQGAMVQALHTRITTLQPGTEDGQPARRKQVTLWTFTDDGPESITPPQVSETPTGQ